MKNVVGNIRMKALFCAIVVALVTAGIFAGCSAATNDEPRTSNPRLQASSSQLPTPDSGLVYLKAGAAQASSFEETPDWAPKPDPMAPVDGDLTTRWSPRSGADNEWISFDLGKVKTVSKVVIRWEEAYATKYEILASTNGKAWSNLTLKEDGKGGVEEISFPPAKARFVKLVGLARINPDWGFSIWEFEIYGPKAANPGEKTLEETYPSRGAAVKAKGPTAPKLAPGQVVPSPGPITKAEFQKGVNYTSWSTGELSGETSDSTLAYLSGIGVRHVAIVVVGYQANADAKEIAMDEKKTVGDEALAHAVNMCHLLGMKVLLRPLVDLEDGEFRTNMIPSAEWFESYRKFILHYAGFSARNNVELFAVGSELSNTTISMWRDRWLAIIKDVRAAYRGPLVYGANWDEYKTVSFWDEMDYIGMDAYFPLTSKKDPTKEELIEGWKARADEIEEWLKADNLIGKPVIFTEIGYDAIDGSNTQPWRVLPTLAAQKEDQGEQTDCLAALMTVISKRGWFKGLYWWNYFPRPDLGPLGYTLRGKKGESVLADWYRKMQ